MRKNKGRRGKARRREVAGKKKQENRNRINKFTMIAGNFSGIFLRSLSVIRF